ncbi:hypothetical protein SPF06_00945 [Sinomonas sp. JGH33]|uniref:Uncharacterized protein n=1 Tax=Sinomonas terricola TaxID=3110330 RepID=A0ABU5T0U7_9MICC|nr:hypothetical protein [Sinomonas sp. JGH33]MEA5453277.1 hypothetical protein [Sinomonas sp. JGH33]
MSALSPRQMFLLDQACQPLRDAFPDYGPYLVGTATERGPYRDVDVRMIMSDESFDKLWAAIGHPAIWFLGLAIGQYLASLTGLPIDFQIQRQTQANETHGGKHRNPLGLRGLENYKGDTPVREPKEAQP